MIKRLQALVDSKRVPHALAIDGGTFSSRLSCAKELAAALTGDTDKVLAGTHPDVITILPEDKRKTISVDQIRRMREDAYIIPNENERKVYIIAKAELMQNYAQNALLKILEEPPLYATFILLCESRTALLNTVLSRVAVFGLSENNGEEPDDNLKLCQNYAKILAGKTAEKDASGLLFATTVFDKKNELLAETVKYLQIIIRDALVIKSGGDTLLSGSNAEAGALAETFSLNELLKKQTGLSEITAATEIYANKNLTLTRLVSKLFGGQDD